MIKFLLNPFEILVNIFLECSSAFLCNISVIDYDINKSRERMTDHESNERDDIDSNNTLQYDRTSFECNNSTNSEDSGTLIQNFFNLLD